MRKIIKKSDAIITPDSLNKSESGLNTRIIVTANNTIKDGSQIIKTYHNKTVLPGRTKILEDVFPITPNMEQHIFLNDNVLGDYDPATGQATKSPVTVATTPAGILPRKNKKLFARRNVAYWCAGCGAMNSSMINQAFESHSTDTKLYEMIPFRFVKSDVTLSDEVRKQYKFEVIYPPSSDYYGYKGYYLKRIDFESTAGINMVVDKQPYTPIWSDTTTDLENAGKYETSFKGNKIQSNYIDMKMNISSEEFKEWFIANHIELGSASSISEIGLVCGLDCAKPAEHDDALVPVEDLDPDSPGYANKLLFSEVYDAELFAHLTFDPYPVSRENATIDFEYRIYS